MILLTESQNFLKWTDFHFMNEGFAFTKASGVVPLGIFLQHILFFRKCPLSHVMSVNIRPPTTITCCAIRGRSTPSRPSSAARQTVTSPTLHQDKLHYFATGQREMDAPGKGVDFEFTLVDCSISLFKGVSCSSVPFATRTATGTRSS